MKIKSLISFVVILMIALMLGGCSQPLKKPDQTPTVPQSPTSMVDQADPSQTTPQSQTGTMGQTDFSSMMREKSEAMQTAMSAPENHQPMMKMMKNPAMAKAMTDIMADPSMKDTFTTMVKDPRLAPIAREALKQ